MNNFTVYGSLTAADVEARVLNYTLLPFNELGHASVMDKNGVSKPVSFSVAAGAVTLPDDASTMVCNLQHIRTAPVGRFVSVQETEEGIVASVRVLSTTAGNDLLIEASEGVRTGISVELDAPVIRDGKLLAGTLTGAGFVVDPAFPSARLAAAEDMGEFADRLTELADELRNLDSQEPPADEETDAEASNISNEEELSMSTSDNAAVPADLLSAAAKNTNKADSGQRSDLYAVSTLIASHIKSGEEAKLTAALQNITVGSVYDDISQPQFLGELWSGRSYQQTYAPLVAHANLTSRKVVGWRWADQPTVADYVGFPNEVPSDTVDTEVVTVNAQRLAGGWKLDREFWDFGETEFINAFFRLATEDYARKVDAKVLSFIVSNATSVTGGAAVSGIAPGTVKIVDGALNLIGQGVTPTFAIVGSDLYRAMVLSPKDNALEFLTQANGLESGSLTGLTIVPSADSAIQGKVFVGAKESTTLFELPGSPIRLSALDVAHNGSDEALIGYFALLYTGKGLVRVV